MNHSITIAANSTTPSGPDRHPAFDRLSLSAEAAALFINRQTTLITIEQLIQLIDDARVASCDLAMEIAGIASDLSREIMRGRTVTFTSST